MDIDICRGKTFNKYLWKWPNSYILHVLSRNKKNLPNKYMLSKISVNSGASASIIPKDNSHKDQKIIEQKST